MNIALCKPPFGSRPIETRQAVLKNYDLGHEWIKQGSNWRKTERVLDSQQLGVLFIERCFKLLADGGRMESSCLKAIFAQQAMDTSDSGFLTTSRSLDSSNYLEEFFLKSEADLRSNILFAEK
jgi:type I restriction enzyme M protein